MSRWGSSVFAVVAFAACGVQKPNPLELVDPGAWVRVQGDADPFRSVETFDPACETDAFGEESLGGERTFGVDVERCGYLTVAQPSLEAVEEGDLLHLRLWHFELTAPEPGVSHLAIALGGRTVFEVQIDVPADSALIAPYWEAPFDFPAGSPVQFHLHNHGTNSYSLIQLTVGGTRPEGS